MAGKRDQAEAREGVTGLAKDIKIWIDALSDQTDMMTAWEVGFVENVADTFENGNLTEKQIERLKIVYDKYY